jgi:hypothetical protein
MVQEREDQGSENQDPHIAKLAVAATCRLCAALQRLGKENNPSALVSV